MKHYYEAYDDRYRQIHEKGQRWSFDTPSPIVLETIRKHGIKTSDRILEIGCGEGRDAKAVLESGYEILATDISEEAIAFCKKAMPKHADKFRVLDCISGIHGCKYDFIYSVAVIHMLVDDADRDAFYRFLRNHLKEDGIALVCSMGDGKTEMRSDTAKAFTLQERNHACGKVMVAGTSCRMVSTQTFEGEIERNGLEIIEQGLTSALPDFDSMLYAVVRISSSPCWAR